jgi:hypothetical protein
MAISQVFGSGSTLSETAVSFTSVSTLTIDHLYQYRPQITIVDESNNLIIADVIITTTTVIITFAASNSGTVFLR